jgi:hypothetical protein
MPKEPETLTSLAEVDSIKEESQSEKDGDRELRDEEQSGEGSNPRSPEEKSETRDEDELMTISNEEDKESEDLEKEPEEEENKLEELRKKWFNSSLRATLATVGAGGAYVAREALQNYADFPETISFMAGHYDLWRSSLGFESWSQLDALKRVAETVRPGEQVLLVAGIALVTYAAYETYKSYKAEKEFKKEQLAEESEAIYADEKTTEELRLEKAKKDWYEGHNKAVAYGGASSVAFMAKAYLEGLARRTETLMWDQVEIMGDINYYLREHVPAEMVKKFYELSQKMQYAKTAEAAALVAGVALGGTAVYNLYKSYKAKQELDRGPEPKYEPLTAEELEQELEQISEPEDEDEPELEALSCPACGAPVSSAASACPYCESGLERK